MIEKVKAEVVRLKDLYQKKENEAWDCGGDEDAYFYQGKRKACNEILTFIDQL